MTDITPPTELLDQWANDYWGEGNDGIADGEKEIAIQAARWGADQELEACCEWLHRSLPGYDETYAEYLRAARRPKPPSLKEQALQALDQADKGLSESEWQQRSDIIRRALETLDD